jgi:hypothetical protein
MGKKRTAAIGLIGIMGGVLVFFQIYILLYSVFNIVLNMGLYYPEVDQALSFVWDFPLWLWAILDILFYVGFLVIVFRGNRDGSGRDT